MVEHVSITPNTGKTGSDGPVIQYSVTNIFNDVSRGSTAEIAKKVKEAYNDDLEGLRSVIGSAK
jgi:hypothetical protein